MCLSSGKFDFPVKMDRFVRDVELHDNYNNPISMKPECLTYFNEHPDENTNSAKVVLFPLASGTSEIVRNENQFEYELNLRFLLGLLTRQEAYVAFDANGNPVKVMHVKANCMLGLLSSKNGEYDFSTKTGACQTYYLLNAFGRSATHSGKKYTYIFWIPFRCD